MAALGAEEVHRLGRRHRLEGDFAGMVLTSFDPCADVLFAPVAVDDEPLGLGPCNCGLPIFGERVVGEDTHVSHGHDKVLVRIIDGDVLGGAVGRVILVAELSDVGRVQSRSPQCR